MHIHAINLLSDQMQSPRGALLKAVLKILFEIRNQRLLPECLFNKVTGLHLIVPTSLVHENETSALEDFWIFTCEFFNFFHVWALRPIHRRKCRARIFQFFVLMWAFCPPSGERSCYASIQAVGIFTLW